MIKMHFWEENYFKFIIIWYIDFLFIKPSKLNLTILDLILTFWMIILQSKYEAN